MESVKQVKTEKLSNDNRPRRTAMLQKQITLETSNSISVYKTCRGSTTHIGDSVQRSSPEGIFSSRTSRKIFFCPQRLQCSEKYFIFSTTLVPPPHVWSQSIFVFLRFHISGMGARRGSCCLMWGIPNLDFEFWKVLESQKTFGKSWKVRRLLESPGKLEDF